MSSTSSTSATEPARPTHHADRLATVSRAVSGSRDGADTKTVTVSQSYPVGIDELWSAVTDGERISRWLMPISGDLRLGGHYQLEGNAGGTIEECVPPGRIAVTWEYAGDVSWVVATLSGGDTDRPCASSTSPTSTRSGGRSTVRAPSASAGTRCCSASRCTSSRAAAWTARKRRPE